MYVYKGQIDMTCTAGQRPILINNNKPLRVRNRKWRPVESIFQAVHKLRRIIQQANQYRLLLRINILIRLRTYIIRVITTET
jgi:hypothetical protein